MMDHVVNWSEYIAQIWYAVIIPNELLKKKSLPENRTPTGLAA